jgi:hypothetical protein
VMGAFSGVFVGPGSSMFGLWCSNCSLCCLNVSEWLSLLFVFAKVSASRLALFWSDIAVLFSIGIGVICIRFIWFQTNLSQLSVLALRITVFELCFAILYSRPSCCDFVLSNLRSLRFFILYSYFAFLCPPGY